MSVYLITNLKNKKQYVGITSKSIAWRWKIHNEDAYSKLDYTSHFYSALRKYGRQNFSIQLLQLADTWEEVCGLEKKYIKLLKTKAPNGYNLTDGGTGAPGAIWNEEAKKKASLTRKKLWQKEEYKQKTSIGNKKRWEKAEEREKQAVISGKLWQNAEYKEKTINNNRESWKTQEHKDAQKKALIKATRDNEAWMKKNTEKNQRTAKDSAYRKKISEGRKKFFELNPEHKEKMSQTTKKYWDEGQEKRRKKHAETMRVFIKNKRQDPYFQKWLKENPPGGKPIQYKGKYFRSTAEASRYFNVCSPTIERHILLKKEGCQKLKVKINYDWAVKYD